ncbi:PaaI family thioesterase [Microbacterium sp. NPDC089189]|uniref:PaaI family thioesterase n=1 Tax=Microbacterium sp. NPDC089189 TaxID=3154972 RepID=UPI003449C726
MSEQRTRPVRYHPAGRDKIEIFRLTGLEQLGAMRDGTIPAPPMGAHIGLGLVSVDDGDVVMTAEPDESHYNPVGSVHGGFFATILDSVCGSAVHSTLPAGTGYTSLEIKVSFLRPITEETGTVTAHGWVTRRGRSAAFAEADLRDATGRVLATASSTCAIFPTGSPE